MPELTNQQKIEEAKNIEKMKSTYNAQRNQLERLEYLVRLQQYKEGLSLLKIDYSDTHTELMTSLGKSNGSFTDNEGTTLNTLLEKYENSYSRGLKGLKELLIVNAAYRVKLALEIAKEREKYLLAFDQNDPDREKKADYLLVNSAESQSKIHQYFDVTNTIAGNFAPLSYLVNELGLNNRNRVTFKDIANSLDMDDEERKQWLNELSQREGGLIKETDTLYMHQLNKFKNSDRWATTPVNQREITVAINMTKFYEDLVNERYFKLGVKNAKAGLTKEQRDKVEASFKYIDRNFGVNLNYNLEHKPEKESPAFLQWVQNTGKAQASQNAERSYKKHVRENFKTLAKSSVCLLGNDADYEKFLKPASVKNTSVEGLIDSMMRTVNTSKVNFQKNDLEPFEDLMKTMMIYQGFINRGYYISASEKRREIIKKAEAFIRSHKAMPRNAKERERFKLAMTVYADKADLVQLKGLIDEVKNYRIEKGAAENQLTDLKAQTYINLAADLKKQEVKNYEILDKIEKEQDGEARQKLVVDFIKNNYKKVEGGEKKLDYYNKLINTYAKNMHVEKISPKETVNRLTRMKDELKAVAGRYEKYSEIMEYNDLRTRYTEYNGRRSGEPRVVDVQAGINRLTENEVWYGTFEYSKILKDLRTLNEKLHEADRLYREQGIYQGHKLAQEERALLDRMQRYNDTREASIEQRKENLKREYMRKHNIDQITSEHKNALEELYEQKLAVAEARLSAMTYAYCDLLDRWEKVDRYAIDITKEERENLRFHDRHYQGWRNVWNGISKDIYTPTENLEKMLKCEEMDREKELRLAKNTKDPIKLSKRKDGIFSSAVRSMYLEGLREQYRGNEEGLKNALKNNLLNQYSDFYRQIASSEVGRDMYKRIDKLIKEKRLDNTNIMEMRDTSIRTLYNNAVEKARRDHTQRAKVNQIREFAKKTGCRQIQQNNPAPAVNNVVAM